MSEASTLRLTLARIGRLLETWGPFFALVLLLGYNGFFGENAELFRRPENLRNIVNQNAAMGIVAVGMTLVIIAGGIDLSVGSIMALAGATALTLVNRFMAGSEGDPGLSEGAAVTVGLAIGLAAGLGCGLLNGLLVTVGRIPAFIATLGGLVAYRSITLAIADAGEIRSESPELFGSFGSMQFPFLPLSDRTLTITLNIILFVAVAIVGQVLLSRTRFGRHLVAVGGNEQAARYSAIPVGLVRLGAFAIMGACAGLAGLMLSSRMNSVSSSQLGLNVELDAIAAVVIGGTSMAGGRGRVWGTVVGVLILAIINNMLVMRGVSVHWQGFVKGVIIVLAVLIQRGRPAS
jgi:ribose transport system permease protein